MLRSAARPFLVDASHASPHFKLNPHPRLAKVTLSPTKAITMDVHALQDDLISTEIAKHGMMDGRVVIRTVCSLHAVSLASPHAEVLLDVGANIGVYALTAAAAGFSVVAIEAMRYNTELLAYNIKRLGTSTSRGHVELLKVAVGAANASMCVRPAPVSSWCPSGVWCEEANKTGTKGNGQLAPASECEAMNGDATARDTVQGEFVPVRTIDSLLVSAADGVSAAANHSGLKSSRRCVAAMKIDIEGHESKALEGARELLFGSCPPCHVFYEYMPSYSKDNGRQAIRLLAGELGYRCRIVLGMRESGARGGTTYWERQSVLMGAVVSENATELPGGQYECQLWRTLSKHPRCKPSVIAAANEPGQSTDQPHRVAACTGLRGG